MLLYFLLRCFAGINNTLENLPLKIKAIINFIARITLEIYVVQYAIIPRLSYLTFPFNWLVITSVIAISAFTLHIVTNKVVKFIKNRFVEHLPQYSA